jgi:hypothetical protein
MTFRAESHFLLLLALQSTLSLWSEPWRHLRRGGGGIGAGDLLLHLGHALDLAFLTHGE